MGGRGLLGIRKEPARDSFVPGAPWGLELDLSPAKSPPELPPTCWEPEATEQGAHLRQPHLDQRSQRRKKRGGERGLGGGEREEDSEEHHRGV